ncbi:MAG: cell envelope integrity EipB family protein [Hyphomicrobiaceae bacterium]
MAIIAVPNYAFAQKVVPPTPPEVLAPHRAVYEIVLADARGASGVSELTGRMVYELTGSACQGYTQNMRFVTRMTNQEGASSVTDMRSSSWEDAVAKAFRFNSSQYKDTRLEESTDGDAARSASGGDVKVMITKPARKAMSLKANTLFPVQHSKALLTAAREGVQFFIADLYDGSEKGEKVFSTASFIGRPHTAGYNRTLPEAKNAERLNSLQSWPISISYFEAGSRAKDIVPAYELAFLYFENGVSRRLFIDYGDFAVRGSLQSLDFLPPAPCKN